MKNICVPDRAQEAYQTMMVEKKSPEEVRLKDLTINQHDVLNIKLKFGFEMEPCLQYATNE